MSEQDNRMFKIPPHTDDGVLDDGENIVSINDLKRSNERNKDLKNEVVEISLHQANSENIIPYDDLNRLKSQRNDIDTIYSQAVGYEEANSSSQLLETMDRDDIQFYEIIRKPGPVDLDEARRLMVEAHPAYQAHIAEMLNPKKSKKRKKAA